MAYQPVKRRRGRRGGGRYITIALVLMCIAVFVALGAFFRVTKIEVEGLEKYDAEEVIEKSWIEQGDNLLLLSESKAAAGIKSSFPYIEDVKIKRELPDKVIISVSESVPVAYVAGGGAYWKLDQNCRLLERTDRVSATGLIELRGITPVSPTEGQVIALGMEGDQEIPYIRNVITAICENNMEGRVGYFDASNISRMSFSYGDKLTIVIGSGADLEEKFSMIKKVLADRADNERGVIDVSNAFEGHFIPE